MSDTAEIEVISEVKIVEFDKFEAELVKFESSLKDIVYDLTDDEQIESAKADKKKVTKTISALDAEHKIVKADVLARQRFIDGKRKSIKDRLLALKEGITDQEDKQAQVAILHAAMLHDKVTYIEGLAVFDIDEVIGIEFLNSRIEKAKELKIDSSYENREADGHMAKAKSLELLQGKLALMEKQAKEAKEAEALAIKQQEEREEQVRKDAKAEAERAAIETAKKVEEDKKAAIVKSEMVAKANKIKADAAANEAHELAENAAKKAKQDQANAVKAAELKAKNEADEKERIAEQERLRLKAIEDKKAADIKKKQENVKHRAKVHAVIKNGLIADNLASDEKHAIKIVKFMIKSESVTINY